ncbi:aldose 1-epimerase [Deinococcus maricopensis]|uniref:Aldose 1-epimerase n=1 Tax=Deinococcus maricopensis (strain DSM 21211 / LMG 22137 / NRRL B-23946 / LB-34) TaxID=709986 RepID=E8U6V1_DEIML|nr:aldose 1-epimerase [Deinococcus maricopensis]ADV66790.1 Aldose 1-epimerase [Deinococcus maricopensis DSM 21211]
MTPRVETLTGTHFTLEVLPDVGASVLNLRAASGRPVLRPVRPEDVQSSSNAASFTLMPFSNRVRDAHFTFAGRDVQLRVTTKDGLTQHGDVRNRPWTVTRTPDALHAALNSRDHADLNWPWTFTAGVTYELRGATLTTHLTLTNADAQPMPAGFGIHPYFARRADGVDPALTLGAACVYDTDDRALPLGAARPVTPELDYRSARVIGNATLDRVYTTWDGEARLDWGVRALHLRADPVFGHVVVFTAPDGSLALEPVSNATDGFNLMARGVAGHGVVTLAPGETLSGRIDLTLHGDWS